MTSPDDTLDHICRLAGIHATHADAFGQSAASSPAARRAIARDFGLACDTPDEARDTLARLQALSAQPVPSVVTLEAGRESAIPLRPHQGGALHYELVTEDGTMHTGHWQQAPGHLILPPLPAGYHSLHVQSGASACASAIIAAPMRCYAPPQLDGDTRLWGMAAQTYGLHSKNTIGIGDFGDVATLAERGGELGASFLGLSPSHMLFPANRKMISPYSPSTRLFLDPIYLDLAALPGFAGSAAAGMLEGCGPAIANVNAARLLDYPAIWALKQPVLEALWLETGHRPNQDFVAFRASQGDKLTRFAAYEALFEHFYPQGRAWSGAWPLAFQNAASHDVEAFASQYRDRISYHIWLQWLCDAQMARAAQSAKAGGMAIGLYRDLAVGAERGGSEIWAQPGAYAENLSIGAPPDRLAPQGQNWGLPPLDPLHLASSQMAAFRAPIIANMRHAGALRIDHAFQLSRLFLVPPDAAPGDGAYVDYPLEAMLGVLRIESHRAQTLVIAEDLGTAPSGFADQIRSAGLFSCSVVPFQRIHDGGFAAPETYPRQALAMGSTHDLPTFAGWWRGLDIDWRHDLGIFDFARTLGFHAARRREILQFCAALAAEGLLPGPEKPVEPPIEATTAFLARTRSALVALQLEDAVGEAEQANLPGVTAGHPNWQRRLMLDIDALLAPDGGLARLADVFAREGRG